MLYEGQELTNESYRPATGVDSALATLELPGLVERASPSRKASGAGASTACTRATLLPIRRTGVIGWMIGWARQEAPEQRA